jgi:hypothetical protein
MYISFKEYLPKQNLFSGLWNGDPKFLLCSGNKNLKYLLHEIVASEV